MKKWIHRHRLSVPDTKAWKRGLPLALGVFVFIISGCASVQSRFDQAQKKGTIEAYERFLQTKPKGSYAQKARVSLERLRFEKATAARDEAALERLLAKPEFPKNDWVAKARETLAEIKADRLRTNESMAGYSDFYAKFGDTDAAKGLSGAYDAFYGRFALSAPDLESSLGYLTRFPDGTHAEAVRRRAEPIWWTQNAAKADTAAYQQYLDLFPAGEHRAQVGDILEKRMWEEAEKTATDADLYLAYLERFPRGRHQASARDCVDWSMAEDKGPKGIRTYMDVHPKGKFADRGQKILKSAETVTEEMETRIWDAVWAKVKSTMRGSPGMSGESIITGWISAGKTYLSYRGVVKKGGQARVLLSDHSRYEMDGTVYTYVDKQWFPVYEHYFAKKKKKKQK